MSSVHYSIVAMSKPDGNGGQQETLEAVLCSAKCLRRFLKPKKVRAKIDSGAQEVTRFYPTELSKPVLCSQCVKPFGTKAKAKKKGKRRAGKAANSHV